MVRLLCVVEHDPFFFFLTAIFFGSCGGVLWLSERDSNFKPQREREREREEWRID